MKKTTLFAVALTGIALLASTTALQAHPGHGHGSRTGSRSAGYRPSSSRPSYHGSYSTYRSVGYRGTGRYYASHGVKLRSGFYAYKGRFHRHWTRKWYCRSWRCWLWFDPSCDVWYYWSGDRDCYLPVRYLTVVPPTPCDPGSVDGPALPPGADSVPEAPRSELPDLPEPN
jgi:hypothetical protein